MRKITYIITLLTFGVSSLVFAGAPTNIEVASNNPVSVIEISTPTSTVATTATETKAEVVSAPAVEEKQVVEKSTNIDTKAPKKATKNESTKMVKKLPIWVWILIIAGGVGLIILFALFGGTSFNSRTGIY